MTVHNCRQLAVGNTGSYGNFYALGCFLTGVLNHTLVSSAGLAASVALPYTLAHGTQASLYTSGSPGLTYVDLPFSDIGNQISVSGSYTGFILALRSVTHPLCNSGLFTVLTQTLPPGATFPSSGTLQLNVDFRSSSSAFVESPLQWSFFNPISSSAHQAASIIDNTLGANFGNGGFGYQTSGSTCKSLRAIYQSPHSTAWQVRLCLESYGDRNGGACNGIIFTVAPGFSGSNGDFPVGPYGLHLHGPMWFNTTGSQYTGTACGLDPYGGSLFRVGIKWQFSAWGDDSTGTCLFVNSSSVGAAEGMCAFGLPFHEHQPLPLYPIQRLFVVGASPNNGIAGGVNWAMGAQNAEGFTGMAMSWQPLMGPISCNISSWTYVGGDGGTNASNVRYDPQAADTPFLGATELLPVDLVAGTLDSWFQDASITPVLNIEPRHMGTFPFARFGRATGQASFALPMTGSQWIHLRNGVYLPWDTVFPLPLGQG